MTKHLEFLAKQAEVRPTYLAHPLRQFAVSESLDDAALAAALKCSPENLTMIRLCRSPEPDRFTADIVDVATRFNADAEVLAMAVHRGQVIERMRERQPEQTGSMLLAARDDDRPDPDTGEKP